MKGLNMKTWTRSALLALATAGLLACAGSTGKTDAGGVRLTVSHFDALGYSVSVNSPPVISNGLGFVKIGTLDFRNITKNPTVTATDLMDIELKTYQVVYRRLDKGTINPPPYTNRIFGNVPHDGTLSLLDLDVMGPEQFASKPLSDLLFANGGYDHETLSNVIPIELQLTFYGKTLSGDDVASDPVAYTLQFTP
jgi:hypothetical protein